MKLSMLRCQVNDGGDQVERLLEPRVKGDKTGPPRPQGSQH